MLKFWLQSRSDSGAMATPPEQGLSPSVHATLKCVPPSRIWLPMEMAPWTTGSVVAAKSSAACTAELVVNCIFRWWW